MTHDSHPVAHEYTCDILLSDIHTYTPRHIDMYDTHTNIHIPVNPSAESAQNHLSEALFNQDYEDADRMLSLIDECNQSKDREWWSRGVRRRRKRQSRLKYLYVSSGGVAMLRSHLLEQESSSSQSLRESSFFASSVLFNFDQMHHK